MKTIILALALSLITSLLHAEGYDFRYDRYGDILLYADKGKERVVIVQATKALGSEKIIFESSLSVSGAGTYVTPKGTVFTLKHLPEPIINDENRGINSGDWQLTVSGNGAEFKDLKPKMPVVELAETPPLVYLGTKTDLKAIRP